MQVKGSTESAARLSLLLLQLLQLGLYLLGLGRYSLVVPSHRLIGSVDLPGLRFCLLSPLGELGL